MAKINVGVSFPNKALLFIPKGAYIGYTIEANSKKEAIKIIQERWKHIDRKRFSKLIFSIK